jgi:hypothetical protein
MMDVVHGCRGLFIAVVQELLGLSFFYSYVWLLLIGVVAGLIIEPTLGHVSASSLAINLKCHVI